MGSFIFYLLITNNNTGLLHAYVHTCMNACTGFTNNNVDASFSSTELSARNVIASSALIRFLFSCSFSGLVGGGGASGGGGEAAPAPVQKKSSSRTTIV